MTSGMLPAIFYCSVVFPNLSLSCCFCFVYFSKLLCQSDGCNHCRYKKSFPDVKFRFFKGKFYGATKFKSLQEVVSIYRPLSNGPSTLPLRHPALMPLSSNEFCPLNLRIVRLFLLLFKTDGLNHL